MDLVEIKKLRRTTRDRVQRGARLLDEKKPGWEKEIEIDHLNMEMVDRCILGQVVMNGAPGYTNGLRVLWGEDQFGCANEDHAYKFGFVTPDGIRDYNVEQRVWEWLAIYWITEIEKRRAS